jgi:hypothetical protein
MLAEATRLAPSVKVNRTKASPMDDIVGILGEFAFAAWAYGDWKKNALGQTRAR